MRGACGEHKYLSLLWFQDLPCRNKLAKQQRNWLPQIQNVPERQLISSANDLIVFTMCDVLEFHDYNFALVACEYQIRLVLSGYLNFLL